MKAPPSRRVGFVGALIVGLTAALTTSAACADERGDGQIAYERDGGVWIVDADGSNDHKVADDAANPAFSPDGGRIAFERSDAVWLMNANGSGQKKLTAGGGRVAWSPDGSKIALVRSQDGGVAIWIVKADGSGAARVSSGSADTEPAWSSDGSKVAFTRYDGEPSIFVVDADGSEEVDLTSDGGQAAAAAWSPDGSKIAYQRTYAPLHSGITTAVWLMNTDGSGKQELLRAAGSPAWSPDGQRIAYTGRDNGVWIMNADGSGSVRLVDGGHPSWGTHEVGSPNRTDLALSASSAGAAASFYGQKVSLTAKVTTDASDALDGAVRFAYDGKTFAQVPVRDGAASTRLPSGTEAGEHRIQATYIPSGGDDTNCALDELAWTVKRAPSATTGSVPVRRVKAQRHVLVHARVRLAGGAGAAIAPSGAVVVFEGNKPMARGSISKGKTNIPLPRLSVGTHTVRLQYLGDPNIAPSTSPNFTLHVVQ